jgi:hypothetical protein
VVIFTTAITNHGNGTMGFLTITNWDNFHSGDFALLPQQLPPMVNLVPAGVVIIGIMMYPWSGVIIICTYDHQFDIFSSSAAMYCNSRIMGAGPLFINPLQPEVEMSS